MKDPTDIELLADYAERQSQDAFAELVRRHVDLVFSVARRLVVDAHLSEDVTQGVFVTLVQQARTVLHRMRDGMPLSGWLYITTRNVAVSAIRTEERRRHRELAAATADPSMPETDTPWDQLSPHLDSALAALPEQDRNALLLRFFERRSAREIGVQFGWSPEAAQKRVTRSLERLRQVLVARGLALPSSTLAGALMVHAVQSAPGTLAASITASVGAMAIPTAAIVPGFLPFIMTTKIPLTAAVIGVAALTGIVLTQHREQGQLREQLASLRSISQTPEAIQTPASSPAPPAISPAPSEELLRLRGEVAAFRRQAVELEDLKRENRRLRQTLGSGASDRGSDSSDQDEDKRMGLARLNYAKSWGIAFWNHAESHDGQMPARLEEVAALVEAGENTTGLTPDQFEILYHGSLRTLRDPARTIVLRERQPYVGTDRPGWNRTYLFADGHSEIHHSDTGDYEAWERERTPPAVDAALSSPADLPGAGAQ